MLDGENVEKLISSDTISENLTTEKPQPPERYPGHNDLVEDIQRDIPAHTQIMFDNWAQRHSGKEHVLQSGTRLRGALGRQFQDRMTAIVEQTAGAFENAEGARQYANQVEARVLYNDRSRMPDKEIPGILELNQDRRERTRHFFQDALGTEKPGNDLLYAYTVVRSLELALMGQDAMLTENPEAEGSARARLEGLASILQEQKTNRVFGDGWVPDNPFRAARLMATLAITDTDGESINIKGKSVSSRSILEDVSKNLESLEQRFEDTKAPDSVPEAPRPDPWG